MRKNKPSIKDYILANPYCTASQVRRATGAERTSIHTMFTALRKVYKTAGVNAAGLVAPEGYPPLTASDFEALCESRLNITKRRKKVNVKARVAPPVSIPEPIRKDVIKPKLLTDDEIKNIWTHTSGKAEGLYEAGMNVDFPLMLVHAIEQWYGLR